MILGGHGTERSIAFGGSNERHTLRIEDLLGRGVRKTGGFFEDEPTIILTSCSTGADAGIAQRLSRTFGAKVIAPKIPTNVKAYHATRRQGEKKFNFSAEYNDEGSKSLYVSGNPEKEIH